MEQGVENSGHADVVENGEKMTPAQLRAIAQTEAALNHAVKEKAAPVAAAETTVPDKIKSLQSSIAAIDEKPIITNGLAATVIKEKAGTVPVASELHDDESPKPSYTGQKLGIFGRFRRFIFGATAAAALGAAAPAEAAPPSQNKALQALRKSQSPEEQAAKLAEFAKFAKQEEEHKDAAPVVKPEAPAKHTLSPAAEALRKRQAQNNAVRDSLDFRAQSQRAAHKAEKAKKEKIAPAARKTRKIQIEPIDLSVSQASAPVELSLDGLENVVPKAEKPQNRTKRKAAKMEMRKNEKQKKHVKETKLAQQAEDEGWKANADAIHAIQTLGLNMDTVKVVENCTEGSLGERCEVTLYDGRKKIHSVGAHPSSRERAIKSAWQRMVDPNDKGVEFSEAKVDSTQVEVHAVDSESAHLLSVHKADIEHTVAMLGFTTPTKVEIQASEGSLGERVEITVLNDGKKIVGRGVHPSDKNKAFKAAIKKLSQQKV